MMHPPEPKANVFGHRLIFGTALFFACVATAASSGRTASTNDSEFRVPVGQRQLFLDDHGVEKIENLKRTMHQPYKQGAVIRSPKPNQEIQTRSAPFWDPREKVYKLGVFSVDDKLWQSADGLNWSPSPKQNMPGHMNMVVYDADDPDPSRRFKAALLNTGFSVSPDGFHWKKLDVPAISSWDNGLFSYNDGMFIHTVKRGGPFGRAVGIAASRDFKTWHDYGVVFHADEEDQRIGRERIKARFADPNLEHPSYNVPSTYHVDVYTMGVFRYEGLYIGLPSMYFQTGDRKSVV